MTWTQLREAQARLDGKMGKVQKNGRQDIDT